jgi:hypothetical protein
MRVKQGDSGAVVPGGWTAGDRGSGDTTAIRSAREPVGVVRQMPGLIHLVCRAMRDNLTIWAPQTAVQKVDLPIER